MAWKALQEKLFRLRAFGIKPGISRMRSALRHEKITGELFTTVAVAGTNGKGTVSAALSAMGSAHGMKVGFFSSPHLIDLRERFRINGRVAEVEKMSVVLGRLLREYGASAERPEGLTFFELTTLAAGVYFKEEEVDLAVLEVGLGGRLDAVNAFAIDLSVITTLGLDHQEYLGSTVEEIAFEKAGVLRAGRPAIIGPQEWIGARENLERESRERGANPVELLEVRDGESLRDRHLRTANAAIKMILGANYSERLAGLAARRLRWPGREDFRQPEGWQGRVLLDGAHNPAGVVALREFLGQSEFRPRAVVWGAMGDKSTDGIARLLNWLGVPVHGALIDNPRAMKEDELVKVIPDELFVGVDSVVSLLRGHGERGGEDLLIFGSLYLIGESMVALGIRADELVSYKEVGGGRSW